MAGHRSWPFSMLVLTGTLAFPDSRESIKGSCLIPCLTGESQPLYQPVLSVHTRGERLSGGQGPQF